MSVRLTVGQRIQRDLFTAVGRIPSAVLRLVAAPPVNADGDVMAPEIAILLRAVAASGVDFSDETATRAREMAGAEAFTYADDSVPFDVVEEHELPGGLRATRYRAGQSSNGLVVYLHGGGFVLGSRSEYDAPVRLIASAAEVDVLSIDYRLAPEHPFPAGVEDSRIAWDYAVEHATEWGIDPERIIIAGDSAGANLAAVLAQELRGSSLQPAGQVLIYPVTDVSTTRPSHTEFADSPVLSAKQIAWFLGHYVPDEEDHTDPRVSPLLSEDLTGLPPAIISVAGFDPLRDDGIAYANRLRESGVPTRLLREGGLVHGFISLTRISPTSRQAVDRIAEAVRSLLLPGGSSETRRGAL